MQFVSVLRTNDFDDHAVSGLVTNSQLQGPIFYLFFASYVYLSSKVLGSGLVTVHVF